MNILIADEHINTIKKRSPINTRHRRCCIFNNDSWINRLKLLMMKDDEKKELRIIIRSVYSPDVSSFNRLKNSFLFSVFTLFEMKNKRELRKKICWFSVMTVNGVFLYFGYARALFLLPMPFTNWLTICQTTDEPAVSFLFLFCSLFSFALLLSLWMRATMNT